MAKLENHLKDSASILWIFKSKVTLIPRPRILGFLIRIIIFIHHSYSCIITRRERKVGGERIRIVQGT